MIHVCFCFTDRTGRYAKFVGTSMLSLFENCFAPLSICTHILHDDTLTADNRDNLVYIAGKYNRLVKFYNVEKLCADKIDLLKQLFPKVNNTKFSIAAFYRIFIPQVLSNEIKKAVYIDADTLVNLNINEFWRIELGDKPLGVVTELSNGLNSHTYFALCRAGIVKGEDYFNSGVLLMNLDILRNEEENIMEGIKFIGKRNGYYDQDVLNYCFSTRALKLPIKFNRFVWACRKYNETTVGNQIYHFSASNLKLEMDDPFNLLWMKYFMKTPWFNENMIGRFYARFLGERRFWQYKLLSLSATVSGKTRIFFVEPDKMESMKKIFSIRDDETIIPYENNESLRKLIDAMKLFKGKSVFFILSSRFPFEVLTKEGFTLGKDFVNGFEFLPDKKGGVAFNSYQIVKEI